jgi:hypothetical protein
MKSKECSRCHETKLATDFYKHKLTKDGLYPYCKKCNAAGGKKWIERNPERYAEYQAQYRVENEERILRYRRSDRGRAVRASLEMKRTAKKRRATPPWLSGEQLEHILEMYETAVLLEGITGCKWHVDHIVPLQGKEVCGLHVPWNLQLLPALENIRKNNKLVLVPA